MITACELDVTYSIHNCRDLKIDSNVFDKAQMNADPLNPALALNSTVHSTIIHISEVGLM